MPILQSGLRFGGRLSKTKEPPSTPSSQWYYIVVAAFDELEVYTRELERKTRPYGILRSGMFLVSFEISFNSFQMECFSTSCFEQAVEIDCSASQRTA
jgi:hypothetical protein